MNNNQYTYNQPPMEQGMQMPPQMGQPMMQHMPRQRTRNNGGWRAENGYWS